MDTEVEENLEEFLHHSEILDELRRISSEGKKSLIMDFDRLVEADTELAKALLDEPIGFLAKADETLEDITKIPRSHLRIKNLDETIEIRGVRAEDVGKFIQVEGILTRASDVKPEVDIATFKCLRCGEINKVQQTERNFRKPQVCQNPNCSKKGPFRLEGEESEFRDWQSLRIQELPEKLRGGRIPRYINAIARDDLVDEAVPGNHVVITGILRAFQETKRNKKKTTFQKVLEVNHITVMEKTVEEAELSQEDEEWIEGLKKDHRVRNLVINSIAPSIFGYERIKEAIALQLFGSPPVDLPDRSRIRGDSHVLLTGDPGTAKSQFLKWTSQVAPRGIYTSGKKATGAGLTAAAVRDELTGGWTLEAGALAIGDGGLACIDEFDKMSEEESGAILESMEQQSYHPKNEIFLADGRKVKIGRFVNEMMSKHQRDVISGVNCEILPLKEDVRVFSHGPKSVEKIRINRVSRHPAPENFVRIKYSNGRSIIVTPEHPVFLWQEDGIATKPAEEVKPGSFVPAPKMLPNSPVTAPLSSVDPDYHTEKRINLPQALNPELARILGYIVTEGWSYRPSKEMGSLNSNPEMLEGTRHLMENEFGLSPGVQKRERDGAVRQCYVSARMYRWFEENFPEAMARAPDKRVPTKVMGASREIARDFLQAAFLGDGSNEGTSIYFRTKSRGLAEDYQDLLLKLSISSRLVLDHSNNSYKVHIAGDSLQKFSEEIFSEPDTRKEKIGRIFKESGKISRNHDLLPTGVALELINLYRIARLPYDGYFKEHLDSPRGITRDAVLDHLDELRSRFHHLRNIVEDLPNNLRDCREAFGYSQEGTAELLTLNRHTIDCAERGGYTKKKRTDLLEDPKTESSRKIEEGLRRIEKLEKACNFRWLRVKEVEILPNEGPLGTRWVYDVTVEPTHNFISQGLLLHNTISVAKAGIVATLNTRTSILAAANPRLGRFDRYDPIPQQIDLPALILSRFDLMFILRDLPTEERDRELADHLLNLQSRPEEVVEPELSRDELRKLIIYAKMYIDPKFENEEAKKKLKDFFVQWRRVAGGEVASEEEVVPITARQLEALVRLAKSNARLRLSDEVTVEDAERAIELFRASLKQLGIEDESGKPDIDILMTGHSRSQREKFRKVMEIIEELEEDYEEGAPIGVVKEEAKAEGIDAQFVDEMIKREKRKGRLYSPREELISRATR